MTSTARPDLLVGAWGRADGVVGVVARIDGDRVTLFDPGQRRQHTVAAAAVERVPAAAVRVTLSVDLPVPHGLDEADVRRWVAMLSDPVLRARAADALTEADLDPGVALPTVDVAVHAHDDGRARCLCGGSAPSDPLSHVTPTHPCPDCGRQLAPPVAPVG